MDDLDFPNDAIEVVRDIYANSTTSFHESYVGTTPPIHISRGYNPRKHTKFIFIYHISQISTKVLRSRLTWLPLQHLQNTCTTTTYVDDLVILTYNMNHL